MLALPHSGWPAYVDRCEAYRIGIESTTSLRAAADLDICMLRVKSRSCENVLRGEDTADVGENADVGRGFRRIRDGVFTGEVPLVVDAAL